MDPLSIAASIIAVVQLAGAVGNGFRRLLAIRGASDQLLQIMNEVTDLEALVRDIHRIIENHNGHTLLDSATLSTLPALCEQVNTLLEDIRDLQQRCIRDEATIKGSSNSAKVKKIAWLQAAEKMKDLQIQIRAMRLRMSTVLISILSLDMVHVRLTLRELAVVPGTTKTTADSNRLTEMARRFETIEGIPGQLREVLEILKPTPPASKPAELIPVIPDNRSDADELVTRHVSSIANPGTRLVADGQTLRLTFNTYTTQKLVRPCPCSCHNPTAFRSSKLLQNAIGQLFVGYTGQISHLGECKECPCIKVNDARVNFTYYFPFWFLSRALEVVFRNSELAGPSLSLRTYRVVADESLLFHFAKLGMIPGIQLLFKDKLASPFDISSKTGRSALHFAADWGQEETCNFLISHGADAHYEDKYLMSPFDIAWEKQTERRPKTAAAAFGLTGNTYDMDLLLKRAMFPLHRAVLGLSPVSVVTQLELSWLEINKTDYWGRTPLSWAAGRGDLETVNHLLKWKADVTIPDKGGWTSLHHAARAESAACIQALIEAGAPVDLRNNRGNTPLAVACSYRDSPEHVLPFLQGGADLVAPMKDGFTALAICMKHNHIACAKSLVAFGASVDGIENGMAYPIHVAASYNSHDCLAWLLGLQKNHDLLDYNRWSLLHHAAHSADKETMEMLEGAYLFGLDPDLESFDGKKPWDIFLGLRKRSLNESPAVYLESTVAFEALLASLAPYHDSLGTSPKSAEEEWFDALDRTELGDSVTLLKEAVMSAS